MKKAVIATGGKQYVVAKVKKLPSSGSKQTVLPLLLTHCSL